MTTLYTITDNATGHTICEDATPDAAVHALRAAFTDAPDEIAAVVDITSDDLEMGRRPADDVEALLAITVTTA